MTVVLIFAQLYLFAAVALILHARSRVFGLAPLLFYLGATVALTHAMAPLAARIELLGGVVIASSVVQVPVVLLILLVLYDVDGTSAARIAILGVMGVSVLVGLVQYLSALQVGLGGVSSRSGEVVGLMSTARSWRVTGSSILAFGASLVAIAVAYQWLGTRKGRIMPWLAPCGALLAAMVVDEVVFRVAADGPAALLHGPGAQLLAKAGAGVLLWPLAAWYLQGVAPGLRGRLGIEGRRPFDLVFGSYRSQEAALRSSTEERAKAQRALQATERRFRATFEQVGVGLVHADAQGRIQLANHAVCALVRRPEAELRGLPWEELVHPEERGACREALRKLLAREIAGAEADRRYVRSNGTDFWAHDTLSLVREAEGEPPYLVLAVESIEDRRGTEERMRHLERMEAVGQLTGGVAHDFNNLLTVIIGGLDLALSDPSEEEEKRIALEDAQEAARRGAELTRRLLAFSRKQALRPTSLDPRKLLDDLAPLLKRALGETVEVETSVAPDAGRCTADRAQMENAIINLALNARDAMPDGGRLTVRCDRVTVTESDLADAEGRPGAYVRISVTDTGLGIPPEHLPRISEPFFTTKETGKGSGLGLSMVYGFVQQSGGFVTVDSEVAKGTSVRLHVPAE